MKNLDEALGAVSAESAADYDQQPPPTTPYPDLVTPDGQLTPDGRVAEAAGRRIEAERSARVESSHEHIEQFFACAHLPLHLREVSEPFGELAAFIVSNLPRNPERTVALRKLLEAKDAAVRARIAK